MKFRFALAGIFAAIFLGGAAHAQTGNGFPLLPPVPHTGQLQNQPNGTHFWFIAAGDNRPAAAGLPQPRTHKAPSPASSGTRRARLYRASR